ncbi:MAG: hypothetical protein V1690_02560 [Candidatus Moraniibacteriota bacterium]
MQKYFTFAEKLLQDINLLRIDDDFLTDVEKLSQFVRIISL